MCRMSPRGSIAGSGRLGCMNIIDAVERDLTHGSGDIESSTVVGCPTRLIALPCRGVRSGIEIESRGLNWRHDITCRLTKRASPVHVRQP